MIVLKTIIKPNDPVNANCSKMHCRFAAEELLVCACRWTAQVPNLNLGSKINKKSTIIWTRHRSSRECNNNNSNHGNKKDTTERKSHNYRHLLSIYALTLIIIKR
jgi:hypothetical protein